MNSRKNAPATPDSRSSKLEAKKIPVEDLASDENTNLSRVLAEVDMNSCEFIDTLAALECSPMYERIRAALKLPKRFDLFDLDLLVGRIYLAGRFDQRGVPSAL